MTRLQPQSTAEAESISIWDSVSSETARPVRDTDGSITRRGFAGNVVIPGLTGECAHARSRDADAPVNVRRWRSADVNASRKVPRARMVLPSHHRTCQHGCGNQPSRQKFGFGH